ncbi:MAG TPA: hypothetical protein VHZ24_08715 [Pirellulales bacterium]|jgi:hypothetical protein|nr:hypothetical protein [Pirellulales bacterium]
MIAIAKKDRNPQVDWVPSREYIHALTAEIRRGWTDEKRHERAELADLYMHVIALASCNDKSEKK